MTTFYRNTRTGIFIVLSLLALSAFPITNTYAQTSEQASERKLVTRVEPEYPEALRHNYIGGMVRVEVVVAPNGTVESAQLLGGNPILGQSAMKAIEQWKYVPASNREKFVVKVNFDPRSN